MFDAPLRTGFRLALVAGVLWWAAISRQTTEARAGWDLVPVLAASVDVPAGTLLTAEMVKTREVPTLLAKGGVVTPDAVGALVGQEAAVALRAGEPLAWAQLRAHRPDVPMAAKLKRATRAYTIEAKGARGLGGLLQPTDVVDVIATFEDPATKQKVVRTLLERVRVLAVGEISDTTDVARLSESRRDAAHVTLEILREEADLLWLAQTHGSLTLALCHPTRADDSNARRVVTPELLLSHEYKTFIAKKRYMRVVQIRGDPGEPADW